MLLYTTHIGNMHDLKQNTMFCTMLPLVYVHMCLLCLHSDFMLLINHIQYLHLSIVFSCEYARFLILPSVVVYFSNNHQICALRQESTISHFHYYCLIMYAYVGFVLGPRWYSQWQCWRMGASQQRTASKWFLSTVCPRVQCWHSPWSCLYK